MSVLIEQRGSVALLTLNRPERANAIDGATARAVDAAVRAAEADASISAIVLKGAGRVFCSGMDLDEAQEHGPGLGLLPGGGFCGITERATRKPLIAAVNGPAIAGGFELALACDLVVAAESATFGLPEVTLGMVAFTGGVQRLARMLPRAVAREIVLLGQPWTAERLFALGLINRIVPREWVVDEACRLAEELRENSAQAIAEARMLMDLSEAVPLPVAIAEAHARADRLMRSDDARSRIGASRKRRATSQGRNQEGG